jgi:dTDP-4-amino-4,6-dideoxygalactose transaminase
MELKVPFSRPSLVGNEREYILESLESMHVSGDGSFTKRCNRLLEELLDVPNCLLTTSCTHALEMAAILLDIQPGDEIIVPSFTFVSTANAFVLRGATPVFVDIRQDTLNLDENLLANAITSRTKAIVPVHYAGVACEMDRIQDLADQADVRIVEDNALGLFARYKGRNLGTFGCMATQSFHETKNIICGEGGALLVNNVEFMERAEILREKGTNRSKFLRGEVDKYTWVDLGSSFLPSDLLAAFLLAQLEKREEIHSLRERLWARYQTGLKDWAAANKIRQPVVPDYCDSVYPSYHIILPSEDQRNRLIAHLKSRGVHSVFHYLPLHISPMGQLFGGRAGDCPVTEEISAQLIRLPLYLELTDEDQSIVINALHEFSVGPALIT